MRQHGLTLRSPQAWLLLALVLVWGALGLWLFRVPFGDLRWAHAAGRAILTGSDPYAPAFAAMMTGDSRHSAYPYPLASIWLVLPLLPLPIAWASTIWVSLSIIGLVSLYPLVGNTVPQWCWLAPLLFYPSLYALLITQWAPIQLTVLCLSLWLYRQHRLFYAGLIVPLVSVKPTTGMALLALALILCASDWRWWQGALLGGCVWYGTPFLLQPDWLVRWIHTVQDYAAPSEQQYLLTLTQLPDGVICFAAVALIALWCIYQRRIFGLGCACLVMLMLLTPHRAHYDYPVFAVPLLFLPRRHMWLAGVAVGMSWLFPLTFAFGWGNSLQLTLFTVAPSILACALVQRPTRARHEKMESIPAVRKSVLST